MASCSSSKSSPKHCPFAVAVTVAATGAAVTGMVAFFLRKTQKTSGQSSKNETQKTSGQSSKYKSLWPEEVFSRASEPMGMVSAILASIRHTYKMYRALRSDENGGPKDVPPEIFEEQFARNRAFFGDKAQAVIHDAFVVVVGLGGVGSHAAHMLVRSGVRKIRIVDFDMVTLSSLNRHACATYDDVGLPKAIALQKFFKKFAPFCTVEVCVNTFSAETSDDLLSGNPDFVLDCIDDVRTKADLLAACLEKKLRVVSALGAGARADPTRLQIADLSDVLSDGLACATRRQLRERYNIGKLGPRNSCKKIGIPCIFSSEVPRVNLLPLTDAQKADPDHFGARAHFRLRIMPVLGTAPAVAGMGMASFTLCEIAKLPIKPIGSERLTKNFKSKAFQLAMEREKTLYGISNDEIKFNMDDIEYSLTSVWYKRDSITLEVMSRSIKIKPLSRGNINVANTLYENFGMNGIASKVGTPCPGEFVIHRQKSRGELKTEKREEKKIKSKKWLEGQDDTSNSHKVLKLSNENKSSNTVQNIEKQMVDSKLVTKKKLNLKIGTLVLTEEDIERIETVLLSIECRQLMS